jgi:hypothetical protein
MAQTGKTPIQIYGSTTASNVPSASNLVTDSNGVELAVNAADGKLFYKDTGGTVQVLAGKGGTGVVAGSNTQVQFNNSGVFGASSGLTWNGSVLAATGFSGPLNGSVGASTPSTGVFTSVTDSGLTSGRVTYASTGGLLADSASLTFDGTTLTAGGLATAGTVTLSGGTANGVGYLNGSKQFTTGSALTFDGATFTNTRNTTDGTAAALTLNNSGTTGSYATLNQNAGTVTYQQFVDAAGNAGVQGMTFRTTSNHPLVWGVNGSEQMRLTSTGLGIGTSSPGAKLDVNGNVTFNGKLFSDPAASISGDVAANLVNTSAAGYGLRVAGGASGGGYALSVNNYAGSELLQVSGSGNLGLGVTPSGWYSGFKGIDVSTAGAISGSGNGTIVWGNSYLDSGVTARYKNNGYAVRYAVASDIGAHLWYTAPSGTAGNAITFTQAMTLDASGNLLVGYTSSNGSYCLQVNSQIYATNATIATSDGRYKEDVAEVFDALSLVSSLRPVTFKWKKHQVHNFPIGQTDIGFIAQDVQSALRGTAFADQVVKESKCILPDETEEQFLGIADAKLIPVLVKAIQEQQALIESLTARVAQLEAQ